MKETGEFWASDKEALVGAVFSMGSGPFSSFAAPTNDDIDRDFRFLREELPERKDPCWALLVRRLCRSTDSSSSFVFCGPLKRSFIVGTQSTFVSSNKFAGDPDTKCREQILAFESFVPFKAARPIKLLLKIHDVFSRLVLVLAHHDE